MKKMMALVCLILSISLLNWMLFAGLTNMFQQPLELSMRSGGRCIAAYPSPNGTYRAEVYLYPETSLSLAGLRVWIEETDVRNRGWNVAYMYGPTLFPYGASYHELTWVSDTAICINGVILDVLHMTYIN